MALCLAEVLPFGVREREAKMVTKLVELYMRSFVLRIIVIDFASRSR